MKPSEAIKELVKKWENISPGYDNPNIEFQDDSTFISDLTALVEEHYVSKEGYIALENMLAKTEAALMEQKQLYFKLFEEEINCMYCEAKIRRGSAIVLCKECAEDNF